MRCGRLRSGHDRCQRWIADRRAPYVPGMTGAAHEFDFWIGEWDVFGPDGSQVGRNTITSMFANPAASGMLHEHWHGNGGVEGQRLRYRPSNATVHVAPSSLEDSHSCRTSAPSESDIRVHVIRCRPGT